MHCEPGTFKDSAAGGVCAACASGRYSDVRDLPACDPCPPGFFSGGGSTACTACGAGSFAALPESGSCTLCAAGRYLGGRQASSPGACVACPSGSFSAASGSALCAACPPGRSTSGAEGAVACASCAPGTFAGAAGLGSCRGCAPGAFADAPGAVECSPCGAGAYQDSAAAVACTPCGAGRFSGALGAPSEASCVACAAVRPGTFSPSALATSADACKPCPATKGNMTRSDRGARCVPCAKGNWCDGSRQEPCMGLPANCLGGEGCAAGFAGERCGSCAAGSFEVRRAPPSDAQLLLQNASDIVVQCAPCDNRRELTAAVLGLAGAAVLLWMAVPCGCNPCTRARVSLRHLFFKHSLLIALAARHFQSLSILYAASALPYPTAFRDFLTRVANGAPIPVGPDCLKAAGEAAWSFRDGWLLRLCLPLVVGAALLCYDLYNMSGVWVCPGPGGGPRCGAVNADVSGVCSACSRQRDEWECAACSKTTAGVRAALNRRQDVEALKCRHPHPTKGTTCGVAAPKGFRRALAEEALLDAVDLEPATSMVASPLPAGHHGLPQPAPRRLPLCGALLRAACLRLCSNAPRRSPHSYNTSSLSTTTWLSFTLGNFLPWCVKALNCVALASGKSVLLYDQSTPCSYGEPIVASSLAFIVLFTAGLLWFFAAPLLFSCWPGLTTARKEKAGAIAPPGLLAAATIVFMQQLVQWASSFAVLGAEERAVGMSVLLLALVAVEAGVLWRVRAAGPLTPAFAPFSARSELALYALQLLVLMITFATGVAYSSGDDPQRAALDARLGLLLIGINSLFAGAFALTAVKFLCCGHDRARSCEESSAGAPAAGGAAAGHALAVRQPQQPCPTCQAVNPLCAGGCSRGWECPMCTLVNGAALRECAACGCWRCACTHVNDAARLDCALCGTSK